MIGVAWGSILLLCAMALAIPLLAIALPMVIILGAIRLLRGTPERRSKEEVTQETRMMQEIHHGLERMAQRLDALETILFDEHRPSHEGTAQHRKDM